MKSEGNGDTNYNWCTWNGPQGLGKRTVWVRNRRANRDYSDKSIFEIGPNTEKSSDDLGRLAVTWTPVKDNQLTLMWKTRQDYNDNLNNLKEFLVSASILRKFAATWSLVVAFNEFWCENLFNTKFPILSRLIFRKKLNRK